MQPVQLVVEKGIASLQCIQCAYATLTERLFVKKIIMFIVPMCALATLAGCAAPLSRQLTGQEFPVAKSSTLDGAAQVVFSADKKYESSNGVPRDGDPLICSSDGTFRVNDGPSRTDKVAINGDEEIAVTSVIEWTNTGFRVICGPFVAFTPEPGAKYIVVNEVFGGKGVSMLWTGAARQSCGVSVYKESPAGVQRVATRVPALSTCRSASR